MALLFPRAAGRNPLTYGSVMDLAQLQARMEALYGQRDRARGVEATVAWLTEELGELARAVRKGSDEERRHELGDVLAWLASLANQLSLSLDDAMARYAGGCPRCGGTPCACPSVPPTPE
jgi:NTP pyrophosphatase (non-canonical NTP hydrolase)